MTQGFAKKNEWLEDVFDRYSGRLLRYAFKLTGSEEQAREVTQETFLRLVYAKQSKICDRVAQWLFTVCRNIIIDRRKKEKRMVFRLKDETLKDNATPAPEEILENKQTRGLLLQLLDSLSQNQQEVIRLRFQNDFSYKEIAEITGFTVSNVGFLMHTGLKALRVEYKKYSGKQAKVGAQ